MKHFLLFIVALSLSLFACRRDQPLASGGVELRFSTDTLYLDTVFKTVASSTYQFKVYNPSDERVEIDRVWLESQSNCIRLNINGTASNDLRQVEILPRDSIYIFVEITDRGGCAQTPTEHPSSFLYHDQVLFSNKGVQQSVDLISLVRDAYFHYPTNYIDLGNGILPYSIISCNDRWTDDKPHIIYGYAVVDSGCVLNIDGGAEVYFHQNSGLWVFNGGSLRVADGAGLPGNGDSVIFAGDRLEPFYEDVPGQWGGLLGGIFIQGGSINNLINNAVIKNATTALRVDSSLSHNLSITNSYILNSSRTGILGGYAHMTAENLVVANAGVQLLYAFGGSYQFRHSTFANYWRGGTRNTAAVALANYLDTYNRDGDPIRIVRDLNQAYFGNCIITGNNRDELVILEDEEGELDYQFNNLLLRHDEDDDEASFDVNDASHFSQVLSNALPDFVDTDNNRYQLDSASQAVDQGNTIDAALINSDIIGNGRNFGLPDLGAFERPY